MKDVLADFVPGFGVEEDRAGYDFTFLDFFPDLELYGYNDVFGNPLLNPSETVGITHLIFTVAVLIVLAVCAFIARRKYRDRDSALVPDGKLTWSGFFEVIFDAVLNMMTEMMGEKNARKYFPLIATLAVYIFFANAIGLIPGLYHPTSNLNTGLACAIVVFLVYNAGGFIEHGIGYLKEFIGPVLWLAPLMLFVELLSHAFRPISLSVRLAGNMTGDGLVLEIFANLGIELMNMPLLLPFPFLFLGLLVSIIQALIFSLLASVYISLAHEDHH